MPPLRGGCGNMTTKELTDVKGALLLFHKFFFLPVAPPALPHLV